MYENIDADSLTALLMIITNLIIIEQIEIMLILVISSIYVMLQVSQCFTEDHCAEQYFINDLINTHIQNKTDVNFPQVF